MIDGTDESPSPPAASVAELPFTATMRRRGFRVEWKRVDKHFVELIVRMPMAPGELPPDTRGQRAYDAFMAFCRHLLDDKGDVS